MLHAMQARRCVSTHAGNLALQKLVHPGDTPIHAPHKDVELIATHTESVRRIIVTLPIVQIEPVSPRDGCPPSIYPARYE